MIPCRRAIPVPEIGSFCTVAKLYVAPLRPWLDDRRDPPVSVGHGNAALTFNRASIPVWRGSWRAKCPTNQSTQTRFCDPMSPREQIMANVAVIKQAIKQDWARMAEDALTPEEREELRTQIKEWTYDLATLGARLDQIGWAQAAACGAAVYFASNIVIDPRLRESSAVIRRALDRRIPLIHLSSVEYAPWRYYYLPERPHFMLDLFPAGRAQSWDWPGYLGMLDHAAAAGGSARLPGDRPGTQAVRTAHQLGLRRPAPGAQ